MKSSQLIETVMSGRIVCVGVLHSSKLETVSIRDKSNPGGARRTSYVTREVVLTEGEPIVVSRWLKDDEKHEDWKSSAKKGDRVLVTVTGMEVRQGIIILNGLIEPLV